MNAAGWLMMVVSISSVMGLTAFCLYRVLMLPPEDVEEHLKAPADIDTGDRDQPD